MGQSDYACLSPSLKKNTNVPHDVIKVGAVVGGMHFSSPDVWLPPPNSRVTSNAKGHFSCSIFKGHPVFPTWCHPDEQLSFPLHN